MFSDQFLRGYGAACFDSSEHDIEWMDELVSMFIEHNSDWTIGYLEGYRRVKEGDFA